MLATLVLAIDLFVASPEGVTKPWQVAVKTGAPRVDIVRDGERYGACLTAEASSFSIQRRVNVDLRTHSILVVRWRADVLPPNGDFRTDRDDQAAQVFVAFRRPIGVRAINYIWDTAAPVGSVGDYVIPLVADVKTVVVESGVERIHRWVEWRRDVAADFRNFFGESVPAVDGLRFQVNSQHTDSQARGCIARIAFEEASR